MTAEGSCAALRVLREFIVRPIRMPWRHLSAVFSYFCIPTWHSSYLTSLPTDSGFLSGDVQMKHTVIKAKTMRPRPARCQMLKGKAEAKVKVSRSRPSAKFWHRRQSSLEAITSLSKSNWMDTTYSRTRVHMLMSDSYFETMWRVETIVGITDAFCGTRYLSHWRARSVAFNFRRLTFSTFVDANNNCQSYFVTVYGSRVIISHMTTWRAIHGFLHVFKLNELSILHCCPAIQPQNFWLTAFTLIWADVTSLVACPLDSQRIA